MRVYPALAVLAGFVRDGRFLKFYNLGVQEWVFRPLLQFVEVRDLFLRRYLHLHPKCLHEAQVERLGAIVGSLHIVRCRCMGIFRVSLYGDLPGVGLTRSDLCLSMWTSMNKFSQDSSCDVNVSCAMNVLKFRLGRFQKIVTRTSRSI